MVGYGSIHRHDAGAGRKWNLSGKVMLASSLLLGAACIALVRTRMMDVAVNFVMLANERRIDCFR
jgi:hypothetical protein